MTALTDSDPVETGPGEIPVDSRQRRFVWVLAVIVGLLCVLPFLYGLLMTPAGSRYLGFQYNLDDHMVYAAWARQAMNGHFLFDNRFAIDPQPSLTIHIYYWTVGILAKLTGIAWVCAIDRFIFGALFVLLLARLMRELTCKPVVYKLGLILGCFGAGVGFLCWQPLGVDFYQTSQGALNSFFGGHLPNDVWQPEAFIFSSLLTNALFGVSLCLILGIFLACLKAKESWKTVPVGAFCMLLLMNIHSYDVLMIAFVLVGLLVAQVARKDISAIWVIRVVLIGLGAIPSALWFLYVLRHDPVFQSRAATLTYTESFRSLFGGYILLAVTALLGAVVLITQKRETGSPAIGSKFAIGVGLFLLMAGFMFGGAGAGNGYWMGIGAWAGLFVLGLAVVYLLARPAPAMNLMISWAILGLIIPYFPALFERKLTMGLGLPWSVLAAFGLAFATRALKGSERRLVVVLGVILLCATSFRWLVREFQMIDANDSNTTMEPVYLDHNEALILDYLNSHVDDHRTVVLAMPGVSASLTDLETPLLPDLNSILSGYAGVYTYAGHWSETPDYEKRRALANDFFHRMTTSEQESFIHQNGIDYIVTPNAASFNSKFSKLPLKLQKAMQVEDITSLGKVVVNGEEMQLVAVNGEL